MLPFDNTSKREYGINMTEKDQYLHEQVSRKLQFWTGNICILGIVLFPLLGVMDYFATPDNFRLFLVYRFSIAAILGVIFLLNRLKRNRTYQYVLATVIAILSAITIELMVLSFGGHASTYYAGLNLLIIAALGLIPFSLSLSLGVTFLIYAIYIIPIAAFDRITDLPTFITNNTFMISTFIITLTWRILSQRSMENELSLQYDLAEEKSKLEQYSTQLEHLVEERTKKLSISEHRYRALFENAGDGIMILDRDGIILNVNQTACEIHGFDRPNLIGTNIRLLETEENKALFEERKARILRGESLVFETEHYRKDGSRVSLEVSSKAIEIEGVTLMQSFQRDVTDKKRLQEQLFQAQKMESIGVLAGGIAHDFNNILSAILGHAELLADFSNLDDTSRQRVKIIENSSRKAGQMISKLLSFARKGNFENVPLNLADIVKDTVDLLERMLTKKNIEIRLRTESVFPPVVGDSNQLEQVVMNLLVNAGDAMPNGGTITIETGAVNLQRDASAVHPLLSPGKYVLLRITDTGTGIPDEIKDRIFDPFFTTKGPGKGTGLGLAMVYGIIKEHSGAITVKSQVGRGTTFEIYLPATDTVVFAPEKAPAASLTGRENILVVDDEEHVLSFIKGILEIQGYRVIVTTNPIYALDLFRQIGDNIDLVITDIVMPLVNGGELIRQFKTMKPSLKLIAVSGYEAGVIGKRDRDIDAFVQKPFEGTYLLSVVRKVLDVSGSASLPNRFN